MLVFLIVNKLWCNQGCSQTGYNPDAVGSKVIGDAYVDVSLFRLLQALPSKVT